MPHIITWFGLVLQYPPPSECLHAGKVWCGKHGAAFKIVYCVHVHHASFYNLVWIGVAVSPPPQPSKSLCAVELWCGKH